MSSAPSLHASVSYAPRVSDPRSVSVNGNVNGNGSYDYRAPYDQGQRRTDRAKSDYALHQQNYGPYMGTSSASATSTGSVSTIPPSSSSSASISTAPANASHPYPPSSSSSSSSGVSGMSGVSGGGVASSAPPTSGPLASSSSARSLHDYAQTHVPARSDQDIRKPNHGPILPPPAAMLSGVGADQKPARIYGIDSVDVRPVPRIYGMDAPIDVPPPRIYGSDSHVERPLPRIYGADSVDTRPQKRVYAMDAPIDTRPPPAQRVYGSDSADSRPLPRVYAVDSPIDRPHPPPPRRVYAVDAPGEQGPIPRIYGIDAADSPSRLPPPAPSAYGSQYSKPLHSVQEESEESRRRSMGQDYPSRPVYGQPYGYTGSHQEPSHSHQQHYQEDGPKYEHDREWRAPTNYPSRTYRARSPEIKPPSWYQNYAHGVVPKPQQPSHYGQHYYPHGEPSSEYPYEHYNGDHYEAHRGQEYDEEHRSSGSKRASKLASQSVHPFDTTSRKSKSKKSSGKRDRKVGMDEDVYVVDDEEYTVKAKRKRANASQLSVLNAAFERSYFPSTEERLRLSKQCRMCPRTVQIWFQNKRQSVKARSDAMEAMGGEGEDGLGAMEGLKRSVDDQDDESGEGGRLAQRHRKSLQDDAKRRSSGTAAPSEAVMASLHIQLDGRSVDYFSRKRRATIAKMEQSEQQQQQQQQQEQQQGNMHSPTAVSQA
ncbi:hypothetical protein BG000_003668 [Podila horticola]|nr:hypothetical protein BG000_003668 [Podila horticola]